VQQAYADVVYKKIKLTVGAKQHPIDLRNNRLTSGGLGIGINAHPVPQVRIEADYFSMPGTNQWWKIRFRGSYGMTTDGRWQEDFHAAKSRYTTNTLYHEKALYWKFGKENKLSIPIFCIELNQIFYGIREASRVLNIPQPNIIRSLKSSGKYSAGKIDGNKLHWIYMEEKR
jgi:hypothetical protein